MNFQIQKEQILKDKYNGEESPSFFDDLRRLEKGEPIDYIIGWKPFLNCRIDLSFKPLIPRPETEYWVEIAIKEIEEKNLLNFAGLASGLSFFKEGEENLKKGDIREIFLRKPLKILDIFSGSGCIGVAILKNCQNTRVDFAEIDENLVKQIKKNLKILEKEKIEPALRGRAAESSVFSFAGILESKKTAQLRNVKPNQRTYKYKMIQSDIFSKIKGKYDFILANPPYVSLNKKSRVQGSVLKSEPSRALWAGKDGLLYIRKFLKQAKNYLNPGGVVWLEFDSFQKKEIEKMLTRYNYAGWEFFKDQFGHWRFVRVNLAGTRLCGT